MAEPIREKPEGEPLVCAPCSGKAGETVPLVVGQVRHLPGGIDWLIWCHECGKEYFWIDVHHRL